MNALKTCRIAALIATLLCLILAIVYNVNNGEPDWDIILILAMFVIALPIGLIARIKNENNHDYLATTKKAGLIIHNILCILVLGIFIFWLFDGMSAKTSCFSLGICFLCIYQLCSNAIVYKLKKTFENVNKE